MKTALSLLLGTAIMSFIGCSSKTTSVTPEKTENAHIKHLQLTPQERAELKCKKLCALSKSLRKRLVDDAEELELTQDEIKCLKMNDKVALCGRCGYILGSDAHKKWKAAHEKDANPTVGFVPHSLRNRILEVTTD